VVLALCRQFSARWGVPRGQRRGCAGELHRCRHRRCPHGTFSIPKRFYRPVRKPIHCRPISSPNHDGTSRSQEPAIREPSIGARVPVGSLRRRPLDAIPPARSNNASEGELPSVNQAIVGVQGGLVPCQARAVPLARSYQRDSSSRSRT
jgi:hypothetical protein